MNKMNSKLIKLQKIKSGVVLPQAEVEAKVPVIGRIRVKRMNGAVIMQSLLK